MRGVIAHLSDRGFGFISREDNQRYFFLGSALSQLGPTFEECGEGEDVTFTPIAHTKGPRAVDVQIVSGQPTRRVQED